MSEPQTSAPNAATTPDATPAGGPPTDARAGDGTPDGADDGLRVLSTKTRPAAKRIAGIIGVIGNVRNESDDDDT